MAVATKAGAGAGTIDALWRRTWPSIAEHPGLTPRVRDLGERPDGFATGRPPGPTTLCHGDPSNPNARTSPAGEIALLDWEDVTAGHAVNDLVWLLVSSVEPARWDETLAAYGLVEGLAEALPEAVRQGLFTLADDPYGPDADAWGARLDEACRRLT